MPFFCKKIGTIAHSQQLHWWTHLPGRNGRLQRTKFGQMLRKYSGLTGRQLAQPYRYRAHLLAHCQAQKEMKCFLRNSAKATERDKCFVKKQVLCKKLVFLYSGDAPNGKKYSYAPSCYCKEAGELDAVAPPCSTPCKITKEYSSCFVMLPFVTSERHYCNPIALNF